jgi:hypothetical protein
MLSRLSYPLTLVAMLVALSSTSRPSSLAPVTVMDMNGDWEAAGDLPWQALLLSLQGNANRTGPHIYLLYPPEYIHPDVKDVLDYYVRRYNLKLKHETSPEDAVRRYRDALRGYVVWDPEVVPSLMVAFTVAGLESALVVTEAHLGLMDELGLEMVADFRKTFRGWSDREIFSWAYRTYGPRTSRDILVYLGERCTGLNGRPGMQPGIADFGIVQGAFFTDLSASPADPEEYRLADSIMADMNDYAYVFGWHSYCKDMEPEHLTMVSRNALVIAEGLATLPNMSFHGRMPLSSGFTFTQRGRYDPNPVLEKKVYLTLIQSDGMGIGSWERPGRGDIPYGWETNMEWIDFAPALLQYYYETATPNDTFIGSLSGPGYVYPKQVPPEKLPGMLRRADALMERLDLHVFGIMDFSQGDRKVGNADLPERVVDVYYRSMPHVEGFINGYGPANTYDWREGRALISYNYYVDIARSAEEVIEDFRELARLNPRRPLFLPVHVRENNDVRRMATIVEGLGEEFVVLPPREFMILAGRKRSTVTRYLLERTDFSGSWKLDPKASKNIFPSTFELEVDQRGDLLTVTTTAVYTRFIHHRRLTTTKTLVIGGEPVRSLEERTRRMGYLAAWADSISTSARWGENRSTLVVTTELQAQTAQGVAPVRSESTWRLEDGGMTLVIEERRLMRDSPAPVTTFVYRRQL